MDVYSSSFNIYPFSEPPSGQGHAINSFGPLGAPSLNAPFPNSSFAPGSRPVLSYPQEYDTGLHPPYASSYPSQASLDGSNQSLPFPAAGRPSQSLPILTSHTPAPPSASVHRHQPTNSGIEAVHTHLLTLTHRVMSSHPGTMVTFSRIEDHIAQRTTGGFNILISGPPASVIAARGIILRESPVRNRCIIRVPRADILSVNHSMLIHHHGNGGSTTSSSVSSSPDSFTASHNGVSAMGSGSSGTQLKSQIVPRLDEIAALTRANISVVKTASSGLGANFGVGYGGSYGDYTGYANVPDGNLWNAGLESEKMCDLIVTGVGDSVDIARVRLLVMLDELSGLHAASIDIDYKLHGIISGRKRRAIQQIMEETGTNIYFPPIRLQSFSQNRGQRAMTPGSMGAANSVNEPVHPTMGRTNGGSPDGRNGSPPGSGGDQSVDYNPNLIWITGEFFNVGRARDALYQLASQKVRSKTIISRDCAILPRKLDWMLMNRVDELKTIMRDQATYISFPALGSSASLITVFGDSRLTIERTIEAVMALAAQFYTASFWLLPIHFNVLIPQNTLNPASVSLVLNKLSMASGSEVVFKSNAFEMHGLEHEVIWAVAKVLELDIVRNFHHEIRFQLELSNEHREFISGKKNGKINKIMSSANVKIKFESVNEHNFLIEVAGTDAGTIYGLRLLQEELPAEMSFHVPEAYHKRIIGVGGKTIQRIMKKYGVYVKFNSADELVAASLDDEENVLARTPAKNALNLDQLKASVMEMIVPKDRDFITEIITIPRRHHRMLYGEKSIFVRDIEAKTNSRITFPGDGLDVVHIFGPESQMHIAVAMLLDHVPFEADMPVPGHPDLLRVATSQDFIVFSENIKREYQVAVIPMVNDQGLSPSSFKFKCQRSNSDCLATVREALEMFLINHRVHVYPSPNSHKRVDSFTDAFPHFNSKLLSTPMDPEVSRTPDGLADRRIRAAASTPDVKTLFLSQSSAPVYGVLEQEELEEDNYRSSYTTSSSGPNDYWSTTPTAMGIGLPRGIHRVVDDPKRGSDSMLDAKLKQPRTLTNRAQSLDLTSLSTSRKRPGSIIPSAAAISETPDRPDTPSDSGTNPSPPASAMIPSFPTVYAPAPGLGGMPRHPLGVGGPPHTAEDIESMFANLNFDHQAQ
ncbi:uncharacterized protein EI90DRAFT_3031069 [Cantharellus anzutake]|uniref:uncharacterized protein n=1 Tax=Cantharellus anzutake TaxID=1750568 RepID=UPI001906DA74|nr:uncharacterized protein EI90DRAFT_3031069 [Cantharellus anzutake]KAF8343016.1 hypothetical protein EI90DRAFT_3031069 [Cantharellus anzutake]